MSTRSTLETDAVWADKSQNILEHARNLERERDASLAKLAKCRSGLEDAKEIVEHAQNYALTRESYHDAECYREAGERIRETLDATK